MSITVKKRDGSREPLDISKIQRHTEAACQGLSGVTPSSIEMNACLEFYDGITTAEIQQALINSAVNLVNVKANPDGHTNYQFAAGFLLNQDLRARVYGQYTPPRLYEIVKKNVLEGRYDPELLNWYSPEDWDRIETFIDHKNDERMSYSAIHQFISKYLVQDRTNKKVYETPQVRYAVIAATNFHRKRDFDKIKRAIDISVARKSTRPTPILAGMGTPTRQFSSCVVIETADDTDSIYASGTAVGKYGMKKAGIGFHAGNLRGLNAPIRGGEVAHTGMLRFVKKWFHDLRAGSQGGIRNASINFNLPLWHWDFEDMVVARNNQGTDETRLRHADYTIILNGYFLQRLVEGKEICFFHPNMVPDLNKAFYENTEKFIELYEKYSMDDNIPKKVLSAEQAIVWLTVKERRDTGRIFLMFVDNVMNQGVYVAENGDVVRMTNLCVEILIPTNPFYHMEDGNGRIGLCTLGSVNWAAHATPKDLRETVSMQVYSLNETLMMQDFLFEMSKQHHLDYAPLGIGVTGLAQWAAQRGFKYGTPEMLQEVKVWMEHQLFYAIEASIEVAKEIGPCRRFKHTRWAQGIFPWELRKSAVNELADFTPSPDLDWERLRCDMVQYGMANANLLAIAPVESSSVVIDSTNGIAHPMELVSVKESKGQTSVQVVPQYEELKDKYELMWESNVEGYLKTSAVMTVFTDQSISTDTYYNPADFPNNKIPPNVILGNIIKFYNWGGKTMYYDVTNKAAVRKGVNASSEAEVQAIDLEVVDEEKCESCVM